MKLATKYNQFIKNRTQWNPGDGFGSCQMPDFLYPFQAFSVEWALQRGRAAILADCGMGKTAMQLAWADLVVKKTNKPVLLLTPLAVGAQTLREAEKFGIEAERSRDGKVGGAKVWITNYQQLHKFNPHQFSGVVGDESSAIKDFKSQTKSEVTEFMRTIEYRSLWTATAAPNDYWELGTSSEALGYLGFRDMITTFFKQETTKDQLGWGRTKYRFRGHAEHPFWSWVCSWAKCFRKPSDIGFDDAGFALPPLHEHEHVVSAAKVREGMLFSLPAKCLQEQREERRNSIPERVDMARQIVESCDGPSAVWCELNDEGNSLAKAIPNSVQVTGSMADEAKEEIFDNFSSGAIQRLITKPKIGCWGLNWQHCSNIVCFPSHSFEQYYQLVRRCWRFGQKNPVNVNLIVSEGEMGVLKNLKRKATQADTMFDSLTKHMNDPQHLVTLDRFAHKEKLPTWL
jgi:hypothetical protein